MGQKLKQKKREQQHEKNEIGCCYYHYIAVVYDLRSYNQNEPADSSSRHSLCSTFIRYRHRYSYMFSGKKDKRHHNKAIRCKKTACET